MLDFLSSIKSQVFLEHKTNVVADPYLQMSLQHFYVMNIELIGASSWAKPLEPEALGNTKTTNLVGNFYYLWRKI